jgi:hypothetical protein
MPTGKIGGKATFKLTPDSGCKAIRMYWQGKIESPVLRAGLERLIRLLQEHQFSRVLCDLRSAEVPEEEDSAWIRENWLPRATGAGFRKFSAVEPTIIITFLHAKRTCAHAQNLGIEGKFFTKLEAAHFWLVSQ